MEKTDASTSSCYLLVVFFDLFGDAKIQTISKKWMTGIVTSVCDHELKTKFSGEIYEQWTLKVDGHILKSFCHCDDNPDA